jgi:hypothetical protein
MYPKMLEVPKKERAKKQKVKVASMEEKESLSRLMSKMLRMTWTATLLQCLKDLIKEALIKILTKDRALTA